MRERNTKGITLIALVITIIVLLILAGVTINLTIGDRGIFKTAQGAANNYVQSADNEQVALNELETTVENIVGQGSSKSTAYTVGQEVTVEEESFYVIEESDSSKSTVTLLAKYNLNTEGTAQVNADCMDTACAFSATNYWATSHAAYTKWDTKKLDINKETEYGFSSSSGDAIYKAKQYATTKGGTNGRLLTYEEAEELSASYSDMIWGKANQQGKGSSYYSLYYWLSSADEKNDRAIWFVEGVSEKIGIEGYNSDVCIGVRPVIEISKSSIS